MTKATEQEVIEIELSKDMRKKLAKYMKKNMRNVSMANRIAIPQFRFLKSVLKKLKSRRTNVMLFSARECSTLKGWLAASIEMGGKADLEFIRQYVENALNKWEEANPET